MKVVYNKNVNIDLGILDFVHPFDGTKFRKAIANISSDAELVSPAQALTPEYIESFVTPIMQMRLGLKEYIMDALEVPRLPLMSYEFLDRKVLLPMRWAVAGTVFAGELALKHGDIYWNMGGGFHHARKQGAEGFCIYNDIAICYHHLIKNNRLSKNDKVLIIDAHHGNGNAYEFGKAEDVNATLLDVYNEDIYPLTQHTRKLVNIAVPLKSNTTGKTYLDKYQHALEKVGDDFKIAFVVAGTDVLSADKLGRMSLDIDDVATRERLTYDAMKARGIPTVFTTGGGYSKDSWKAIAAALTACLSR